MYNYMIFKGRPRRMSVSPFIVIIYRWKWMPWTLTSDTYSFNLEHLLQIWGHNWIFWVPLHHCSLNDKCSFLQNCALFNVNRWFCLICKNIQLTDYSKYTSTHCLRYSDTKFTSIRKLDSYTITFILNVGRSGYNQFKIFKLKTSFNF